MIYFMMPLPILQHHHTKDEANAGNRRRAYTPAAAGGAGNSDRYTDNDRASLDGNFARYRTRLVRVRRGGIRKAEVASGVRSRRADTTAAV